MKLCYIFNNSCLIKQHYNNGERSQFPIRGAQCGLNNESEDDYSEEHHESEDDCVDDDANDEDIPSTGAFIQHSEDPPSFLHALDLDVMQALEFPEHVNMAGSYVASDELCVGMEFSDREAIV